MLKNRVLASFGALFACGAAVAVNLENYIPLFLFLVAGVLCGYLCIARLLRRKPRIRRTLAYAAAPLLAIAFTFVYRALFITPYYALDGAAVKGAGTVVEVREYAAGGYLEVEIEEADTPLAEGLTVRLYLADGANLPACGFTVEFEATLRVPENGTSMAADRVLLVGPPGTGKTLLARAVAGEANVAFLSISGSDFVELYVGVGASRVRDLFEQAKRVAPAIVFIDEIDAVGRQRGAGLGGGHDEREQTLNQLLVEMDGFSANEGVIVIAATNRKDILDPALLRPGRFDRQIYVGAPDWRGRLAILQVHARKKPLADNVDLPAVAKATAGFTGADLANLLNEGALLAARRGKAAISQQDLETSMIKVIAGPEKKSRVVSHAEKMLTAVHEAGHAICMYCLDSQDPVHLITIIPRAQAGGMTISLPQDDRSYSSRNEMFETIVSFLGGRVAEAQKLCDISTGASNDLQRATGIARDMVAKYGMSDSIGPVSYAGGQEVFIGRDYEKTKPYSEQTAGQIDAQVQKIMREAYQRCEQILRDHAERLDKIASFLMENENMSRTQFEAVMQERLTNPKPEFYAHHVLWCA
mgnify:CR=1 FL=1